MNFRIKIVDKDVFKEAVDNFQRFLNSDIKIRIEEGDAIFDFDESEQSRWHLFTLASFYGSQLFNKRKRLRLLERQTCNVVVPKPITNQPIEIRTDWNQKILFNPVFLLTAESSMIRRFIDMLSEYDQIKLKNANSDIDFAQPVSFKTEIKYAYQILGNTLILIKEQGELSTIVSLWKVEWYEV